MVVVQIVYNLALLVAISVISGFIRSRFERSVTLGNCLQGIVFGVTAMIGMLYPFVLTEGIIFDGRSVVLSICSLFYGPLAGILAGILAAALRIYMGGGGAVMGVSVITESIVIGILFHYLVVRRNLKKTTAVLYLMGIVVHIVMVLLMMTLPAKFVWLTFRTIALTVMLFYPLATILIGKILNDQEENRRLIRELSDHDRFLNNLLETIPIPIFFKDLPGRYIGLNKAFSVLFGKPKEFILGKTIAELYPADLAETFQAKDREFYSDAAATQVYESQFPSTDGTQHSVLIHKAKITDETGAPAGLIGAMLDITERKRAEQELRESESKFRRIFEEHSAVKLLIDPHTGAIIDANRAAASYYGWTCDELRRMAITDVNILPADVVRNEMEQARQLNRVFFQFQHRLKDGSVRDVEVFSSRVNIGGKELLHSIVHDVTEKRKAEQSLAAEKEQLAVTLRSIGDGVITTDTTGRVVIMNRAAERLTGWTQQEAAGKPLPSVFSIVNSITREPCGNPVDRILNTGAVAELEAHTSLVTRDGREILIADSAAPIFDNHAVIIGAVLVFRDMTEKQRMIESIQRADKLQSIGVLAGGIAHDFNNMLGGIFGYIEMARAVSAPNDKSVPYLEKAMKNFSRAKDLTQQLLTFAKGGIPVKKTASLAPLLTESARFAMSGSNVSLTLDIASDLWLCDFDENQLGQVVDNIVINAQQAMPLGGTLIIAAANVELAEGEHPALDKGRYVCVSFTDTGVGIPQNVLSRIFDPFFTTKQKGTGLGLATVYSIIKKHGGDITVQSEPGKGTTFRVCLPVSDKAAAAAAAELPCVHRGSGTVLVMDDEETMRETAGDMLRMMGYTVDLAAHGQEAIEKLRERALTRIPYRAVIMDLTIPGGMGGRDAITHVRAMDTELPVFVASGYSEDPVMANPAAYGFTDRLRKPFSMAELEELLERHLGQHP